MLATDELKHISLWPVTIENGRPVIFKFRVRFLGFHNITMIEQTEKLTIHSEGGGWLSGRTSDMHIKSEEGYYEAMERVRREREEMIDDYRRVQDEMSEHSQMSRADEPASGSEYQRMLSARLNLPHFSVNSYVTHEEPEVTFTKEGTHQE